MAVTLCVLLWARDGQDDALIAYEDAVLALVPSHGGRVQQRVRSDGRDGHPLEVHLVAFPSEEALDAYLHDDARVRLDGDRARAVLRSQVIRVEPV